MLKKIVKILDCGHCPLFNDNALSWGHRMVICTNRHHKAETQEELFQDCPLKKRDYVLQIDLKTLK